MDDNGAHVPAFRSVLMSNKPLDPVSIRVVNARDGGGAVLEWQRVQLRAHQLPEFADADVHDHRRLLVRTTVPQQLHQSLHKSPTSHSQEKKINESSSRRKLHPSVGRCEVRWNRVLQSCEDVWGQQQDALVGVQETGLPKQQAQFEVES